MTGGRHPTPHHSPALNFSANIMLTHFSDFRQPVEYLRILLTCSIATLSSLNAKASFQVMLSLCNQEGFQPTALILSPSSSYSLRHPGTSL